MPEEAFAEVEVLQELESVLRDPAFRRAPALARLLRYLVNETLAGRGDVSADRIAVECFGRPETFDSQRHSDPPVQVTRLRRLLSEHYRSVRGERRVLLDLVPGDHRIRFARSPASHEPPEKRSMTGRLHAMRTSPARRAALWASGASLIAALAIGGLSYRDAAPGSSAVAGGSDRAATSGAATMAYPILAIDRIEPLSSGKPTARHASWLTAELRSALPRFRRLTILDGVAEKGVADYRLTGDVLREGSGWLLRLRLTDERDRSGGIVWRLQRSIDKTGAKMALAEAARSAVTQVAQQRGIIHSRESRAEGKDRSPGYRCLMLWRDGFDSPDIEDRRRVRNCLDSILASGNRAPAIPAALAWSLSAREQAADPRTRNLDGALAAARSAVALDPSDSFAQMSLGHVQFLAGDPAFAKADARALALNPYDPDVALYVGLHRLYAGDESGAALLDQAERYHVQPPAALITAQVVAAVLAGDDDSVRLYADRMVRDSRARFPKAFWQAIAAGARGDRPKANAYWREFEADHPLAAQQFQDLVAGFGMRPPVAMRLDAWIERHVRSEAN